MSYKIKRLEEYIGAALAGVLHVDPHLPVLLAALVVIPVGIFIVNGCIAMLLCLPIVLPPREHCCQPQVEEHWAQQQPAEWEVTRAHVSRDTCRHVRYSQAAPAQLAVRGRDCAGPRPQRVAQPEVGPHLEAVLGPPEDHHQEVEQPRRQVPDHQPVHAHEGADGVVRDVEHREDDVGEGEEEARQQEDDHSHQHPLPHHVGLGIKLLTLCR